MTGPHIIIIFIHPSILPLPLTRENKKAIISATLARLRESSLLYISHKKIGDVCREQGISGGTLVDDGLFGHRHRNRHLSFMDPDAHCSCSVNPVQPCDRDTRSEESKG